MKRDDGSVHRLFSLFLIAWMVVLVGVAFTLAKAAFVDQHIEDSLMQANLSALLIDPYQYDETGELVFANALEVEKIFEESLNVSLGGDETLQKFGILDAAKLLDFRLYEVRTEGILETVCEGTKAGTSRWYELGAYVLAPDGTQIVSSSIYAKIAVPVKVGFGIEVTAVKEHCVDIIVSEEIEDEET